MLIVTPSSCRVVAFHTKVERKIRLVDDEVPIVESTQALLYARIEKVVVKSVFPSLISPLSCNCTCKSRGGNPVIIR